MAGFSNETMYANNVNFAGGKTPTVSTDGQLLIGSTASPNIRVGNLTSTGGTITITNGAGTINIETAGGSAPIEKFTVDTTTGAGTNPVVPDGSGIVTITGGQYASGSFGTRVITIVSTAANTYAVQAQISSAVAAADQTKNGIAHFDSSSFAVAATGFVTASGTGLGKTITGDSGGALPPTAGNWNILGGPGVTTSGSGSTLTINSVVFTDTAAATLVVDNGYFATAAGTYGLPASPAQGEMVIIVADTAGAVAVDAASTHVIRIGNNTSSAGGTATSNAIGDSLTLRYRTSNTTWHAVSVVGTWTLA